MKLYRFALLISCIALLGCKKKDIDQDEREYASTDVFVKVKGDFTIQQVFDFINSLDHDVENIQSQTYTSGLPSDSLQYVMDYLNAKSYTNDGTNWFVNGYNHYQTQKITIFPRLFDMTNVAYQADWLSSMHLLNLKEDTESETAGCVIYFHVPEGSEKKWVEIFEAYEFVEWAELNYTGGFYPH